MSYDDRRNAQRSHVRITADLRRPGRTAFRVTVTDLSQTGCRCETTGKVVNGDIIWITLPGFSSIEGTVRWVTPHGFGCAWNSPMHISVFQHISEKYPDVII